ncbi:MAG TPA: hypothetical protein VF832_00835, partial [Longimicrobiales bacterium]
MRPGLPALALLAAAACPMDAQQAVPMLSRLAATRADPVYTTYAAGRERSRFVLDEGYHLRFYDPGLPIELTSSRAGDLGLGMRLRGRWVYLLRDMAAEPVITTSYGDIVRYHYRPFADVRADVTFLVYSSRLAVQDVTLSNSGAAPLELDLVALLRGRGAAFGGVAIDSARGVIRFAHREPPDSWTSGHAMPHVSAVSDVLLFSARPDCMAALRSAPSLPRDSAALRADTLRLDPPADGACPAAPPPPPPALPSDTSPARLLMASKHFVLAPGQRASWRLVRGVSPADSSPALLEAAARRLLDEPLDEYVRADERLYARIPPPPTSDPKKQLLYWGAFTLLHQVMLPPEGATRFPYYVFSREPQWGWGHGGQVFHES